MNGRFEDPAGLVDLIYEAGLEPETWPAVLTALRDRLSGTGGALHVGHTSGHGFAFGAAVDVDPECLDEYERYTQSTR